MDTPDRTPHGSGSKPAAAWTPTKEGSAARCAQLIYPVPFSFRPARWLTYVNEPQSEGDVERLRECLRRRRPYGDEAWTLQTARRMDLEASLRPRGRPPKKSRRHDAPK